ncbi:putative RNA helicase [Helianthus debilis subsp. tardiflorus]
MNKVTNMTLAASDAVGNEQGNQYDILVASDAVGMGLNLKINCIVFYSLSKYNGDKIVPTPASQVKQIRVMLVMKEVLIDGFTIRILLLV